MGCGSCELRGQEKGTMCVHVHMNVCVLGGGGNQASWLMYLFKNRFVLLIFYY